MNGIALLLDRYKKNSPPSLPQCFFQNLDQLHLHLLGQITSSPRMIINVMQTHFVSLRRYVLYIYENDFWETFR